MNYFRIASVVATVAILGGWEAMAQSDRWFADQSCPRLLQHDPKPAKIPDVVNTQRDIELKKLAIQTEILLVLYRIERAQSMNATKP